MRVLKTGAFLTGIACAITLTAGSALASNAPIVPVEGGTPAPVQQRPVPVHPCSGQILGNSGFETGTAPWKASEGVIDTSAGEATHSGVAKAWLGGYGAAKVDSISQPVTIPAGCHATLVYWLHIDTAETGLEKAYDTFAVRADATPLSTFDNLDHGQGYTQHLLHLDSYAGKTFDLGFVSLEDTSLQTSFVVDDVTLTLS